MSECILSFASVFCQLITRIVTGTHMKTAMAMMMKSKATRKLGEKKLAVSGHGVLHILIGDFSDNYARHGALDVTLRRAVLQYSNIV